VFVQSNFGRKRNLTIAGVPVGKELKDTLNNEFKAPPSYQAGDGSIIVVVATDAPLLPHQLKRVVQRVSLGIGLWVDKEQMDQVIFLLLSLQLMQQHFNGLLLQK
jgi:L-aminopeptidase/D-esterase-like protein